MEIPPRSSLPERLLEGTLFASRWVLAPIYLGLVAGLVLLLINFVLKTASLLTGIMGATSNDIIIGLLSLVDLSLVANLVLIVIWAGYENFVSSLDLPGHKDRPDWIAHIGYSDLKLKLLTSILAISAISVLEDFMHLEDVSDRHLYWAVGIHLMFVLSALVLAVMGWLAARTKP